MMDKFITKDSGKRMKWSSGMNRDVQDDKPRYDLCYLPLIKRWAELMQRGAIKYGERNWEKATSIKELNRFKASALRHMMQIMLGEEDEDHYAAVCFNLGGILLVQEKLKGGKK